MNVKTLSAGEPDVKIFFHKAIYVQEQLKLQNLCKQYLKRTIISKQFL